MEKTTIKTLLVEDNPSDVLILTESLDRDPLSSFALTHAEMLSDALALLEQDGFDVILLDLGLPDSFGLETFASVFQAAPNIPTIVLSGHSDEALALEAVQAGAQDYLVKGPAGWGVAARSIRYAIERQKSAQRFYTVFHNSPTPQSINNAETGQFVEANAAYCQLVGYARKELLGHTTLELGLWVHPETREKMAEKMRADGYVRDVELEVYTRSKEARTLIASTEPIELHGEKCILSSAVDITERKQAEAKLRESDERFSTAFFTNPVSQSILSLTTGLTLEVNDACCSLYGFSREELIGVAPDALNLWGNPANQVAILDELQKSGHVLPTETTIRRKSGEIRTILFAVEQITWQGMPCLITSSIDITERKKAQEALKEEQHRFTRVAATVPGAITVLRSQPNGKFNLLYASQPFEDVFGLALTDLNKHASTIINRVSPAEIQTILAQLAMGASTLQPVYLEFRYQHPLKGQIWLENRAQPVREADGSMVWFGFTIDITGRIKTEQVLRERETLLQQVLNSTRDAVFVIDREYRLLTNNQQHQQALIASGGHPLEVGELVLSADYPTETLDFWRAAYDRALRGDEFALETTWTGTKGQPHFFDNNFSPLRDAEGEIIGALVVIHNITERKQAEAALERVRKTLAEAQKIAHLGSFEYIAGTQTTVWSDEEYRIYGLDPAEPSPTYDVMLQKHIHPQDAILLNETFTKALQSCSSYELEHRVVRPDGSIRCVHDRAHPFFDEQGKLVRYVGVTLDITERKQTEEKLRASEEKYRGLLETLDSVVAAIDQDGKFLYMNEIAARQLGGTPQALIGKTMRELFPAPVASQQLEGVRQVIREDQGRVTEALSFVHGETHWFRNSLQPIHDEHGQVIHVMLQATDIHALKTAQQELTELNRTLEQRIKQATAEIQDLYDNAPTGYHSLDANGNIVMINQTELNWLGYTRTELLGQPFTRLFTPANLVTFQANFPIFKQRGWIRDLEFDLIRKDGSSFPVLVSATAIKDETGNYVMSRSTVFDNTERKKAGAALRESEDRYRTLIEFSPMAIVGFGEDTKLELINQRAIETLGGTSPEDFIGKPILDLVHPDYRELARERIRTVIASNTSVPAIETVYLKLNGQSVHVVSSGVAMHIQGRTLNIVSFFDNTERKKVEEALKASENKYRHLFENMTEGFSLNEIITTENGQPVDFRVLDANEAYGKHTGLQPGDVIGKTMREITPQVDPQQIEEYGKVALTGEPLAYEYFSKTFNRHFSERVFSSQWGQFATLFEDITERKKAEQSLRESHDQLIILNLALEQASRTKDEFLANMSHELRTPLNGILGISEILLSEMRGPLNDYQRKLITFVDSGGRHLLSLINDILDLSKIESGQLELHLETIAIEEVCQASLSFVKEPAIKKGLALSFIPDPKISNLLADPRRLKQILVNLLSNAVKFTPSQGRVVLKASANLQKGCIEFSVTDSGVGISPQDLARLFQPFTQVDSSLTRQHEGTGLGLALVKRLAEMHGGSIRVESEVGQGSCFTVSLPWQRDSAAQEALADADQTHTESPARVETPATRATGTILLAEDTETNILTFGDYLESLGYTMIYAYNGREAVEKAEETSPDLILMDMQMPVMNGMDATRKLRANPRFASTPIIALTALAMTGDRERFLASGVNEYLSKPVRLKQLAELIQELLKNSRAHSGSA